MPFGGKLVLSVVCCACFLFTGLAAFAEKTVAEPAWPASGTVEFRTVSGESASTYYQGSVVYLRIEGISDGGADPCFSCEVLDSDMNTQYHSVWNDYSISLTETFTVETDDPVGKWKVRLTYSDLDTLPRVLRLGRDMVDVLPNPDVLLCDCFGDSDLDEWTVIGNGYTVVDATTDAIDPPSLKVVRKDPYELAAATRYFTPQHDAVTVQADMRVDEFSWYNQYFYVGGGGHWSRVTFAFRNGYFAYATDIHDWVVFTDFTVEEGVVYEIKFVIDVEAAAYDIYVNDELLTDAGQALLRGEGYDVIDCLTFRAGYEGSYTDEVTLWADNVLVTVPP